MNKHWCVEGIFRMDISKEYRLSNAVLIVFISLLVVLFFVTHNLRLSSALPFLKSITPQCFVKEHTGLTCKTCGLGRSIEALSHGDFAGSRRYHPYGYLFFLFFCLQVCLRSIPLFVTASWVPWVDMGQIVFGSLAIKVCAGS